MISGATVMTPHSVSRPPAVQGRAEANQQRCSEAVERLLARFGWRLLTPSAFALRTYAYLRAGIASDPHRAATYTYSQALYVACSGAEGAARQNLAYSELFRYLSYRAARQYPDIRDDAVQSALTRTFAGFARCRRPETFFAFALQQLTDAARPPRRQGAGQVRSLDAPIGEGAATLADLLPDLDRADPVEQAITREQDARLRRMADEFRRNYPRARDQMAALWLKYVDGLSDVEISRRLGKSINNIYVLRSRAIAKLEKEPSCRALAMELGIRPRA
ncbi:MAG: RNA polymerase sigma factor [Chloroflexota bacterium]